MSPARPQSSPCHITPRHPHRSRGPPHLPRARSAATHQARLRRRWGKWSFLPSLSLSLSLSLRLTLLLSLGAGVLTGPGEARIPSRVLMCSPRLPPVRFSLHPSISACSYYACGSARCQSSVPSACGSDRCSPPQHRNLGKHGTHVLLTSPSCAWGGGGVPRLLSPHLTLRLPPSPRLYIADDDAHVPGKRWESTCFI